MGTITLFDNFSIVVQILVPPEPVVPVKVVGLPRNCEKIPFTPVLSLLLRAPESISLTVLRQPSIAPDKIPLNQFSRAFIKSSTIQIIALFLTCFHMRIWT